MAQNDDDGEYKVGYGKPPEKHRFKKGESGNPKGRPKGSKNFKTDLQEELAERVPVREGGRLKRISKQRLVIKSLVARAIKPDSSANAAARELLENLRRFEEPAVESETPLSVDEAEALEIFSARLLRQAKAAEAAAPNEADPKPAPPAPKPASAADGSGA